MHFSVTYTSTIHNTTETMTTMAFSTTTQVSRNQNTTILDFTGARTMEVVDGDNWSYKTCKAPCQIVTSHHKHINTKLFTDALFLLPN